MSSPIQFGRQLNSSGITGNSSPLVVWSNHPVTTRTSNPLRRRAAAFAGGLGRHGILREIWCRFDRCSRGFGLLERLGVAEAIRSKLIRPETDTVSELVASGQIELDMVVITQILTTPGVELVGPLPPEIQSYLTFTGGVSTTARNADAAKALLTFLTGRWRCPSSVPKAWSRRPGRPWSRLRWRVRALTGTTSGSRRRRAREASRRIVPPQSRGDRIRGRRRRRSGPP
jgi:hypothetical protein